MDVLAYHVILSWTVLCSDLFWFFPPTIIFSLILMTAWKLSYWSANKRNNNPMKNSDDAFAKRGASASVLNWQKIWIKPMNNAQYQQKIRKWWGRDWTLSKWSWASLKARRFLFGWGYRNMFCLKEWPFLFVFSSHNHANQQRGSSLCSGSHA